jgi:shikimate kinase
LPQSWTERKAEHLSVDFTEYSVDKQENGDIIRRNSWYWLSLSVRPLSGENQEKENGFRMKNIVLIGMPGTGKSVVGRALAARLEYTFVDVDDLIAEAAGKTLPEILRTDGLESFVELEGRVGESLNFEDTVIATGGSMVLSEKAMEHLKKNGVVVWLETPISQISDRMPEDLTDRGIAAPSGMTIREIYEHRLPLYAKHADLIVASKEGESNTAQQVEDIMRTVGIDL